MSPAEIAELADTWLAHVCATAYTSDRGNRNDPSGSFEKVWDICREDPEAAWSFILYTLADRRSEDVLSILAAGPLEDLLAKHGDRIIERVELEARRNPRFAMLLGGVWQNVIDDAIWQRVKAVWDLRGWDGISSA